MTDERCLSRRRLLTIGAAAGTSAALGLSAGEALAKPAQVPRRVLGKTNEKIPILLLGGGMGFKGPVDPRIKLALKHGVNYIDTARVYAGGSSERNAGSTLARLEARATTWITSKSPKWSPRGFEQDVALTLDSMKTDHIDLYFLHALDTTRPLEDKELIKVIDRLKKAKKIRYFGFSCHHGNVPELLQAAARHASFVDAVMFRYSFRDYGNRELNSAIDAAHKAGVGLIAMKTQGSEAGIEQAWKKFEQTGKWNKFQAVLKAVWADERITAAVSHMETMEQLRQNITAAIDGNKLGVSEREALDRYAAATRPYACAGCDHICGAVVSAPVSIATATRALMYHDSYGDLQKARSVFARLALAPGELGRVDFSAASRACPRGVDVASLMKRASEVLA